MRHWFYDDLTLDQLARKMLTACCFFVPPDSVAQFCWTRVTQQIEPALQPLLARGSILCSDGNQSYIKVAEMGAGIIHKRLIVKEHHRVEDDVFRIQTLNNYVNRWRGWMLKFHGVGTAYLANYLAWFRTVEQEPNTIRSWLQVGCQMTRQHVAGTAPQEAGHQASDIRLHHQQDASVVISHQPHHRRRGRDGGHIMIDKNV